MFENSDHEHVFTEEVSNLGDNDYKTSPLTLSIKNQYESNYPTN